MSAIVMDILVGFDLLHGRSIVVGYSVETDPLPFDNYITGSVVAIPRLAYGSNINDRLLISGEEMIVDTGGFVEMEI